MAYLPIFLDVTGRRCVVVGGGEVAARKVASLLEAGADVVVVSPAVNDELDELARHGRIMLLQRGYETGDIEGAALVYAATDHVELQRRIYDDTRARAIPLNLVDVPSLCTFITPAVMTRGSLQIAVSTEGASPAMAKRIVARLERLFGPEYGLALEVLRAARRHLQANEPSIAIRAKKLTALAAARIPEYLRNGDLDAVEEILRHEIGVGLDGLGLSNIRNSATAEATLPVR
jgi:precorrin-2 dehydrogenase/sirohydrochlorin ferrochelatase